jgi:hypothetical protein
MLMSGCRRGSKAAIWILERRRPKPLVRVAYIYGLAIILKDRDAKRVEH